MKNSLLLSIAITCMSFVSVSAQTVLFSGDQTPSQFSRMDIISWGMGDAAANYLNFGTEAEPAFTEIAANPDKTGLNKTDKALHMYSLKGHSWWPDFVTMTLNEGIAITEENRYLHVYHYRENLNKGFTLYLTANGDWAEEPEKGTKRFDLQLAKAGVWEDVVIDLKWFMENETPLQSINFLVDANWGNDALPATHYYWDEIELNNSRLPRGFKIAEETELAIDLGHKTSYDNWVSKLDLQHSENTSEIVANPFTDQKEVLASDSVMKFSKSENASWWEGGPRFQLEKSLKVGTNGASAYLHVFVNIPDADAERDFYLFDLNAKDFAGNQVSSGIANKYWTDEKGGWFDMVLDVTSLGYVSEFSVRFDIRRDEEDKYINSPAGVFYLDDIVINGSEEPREKSTLVSAKTVSKIQAKAYGSTQKIVVEGEATSVEIFTLSGSKMGTFAIDTYRTEIPVSKAGFYLVKLNSANGTASSKVLVR